MVSVFWVKACDFALTCDEHGAAACSAAAGKSNKADGRSPAEADGCAAKVDFEAQAVPSLALAEAADSYFAVVQTPGSSVIPQLSLSLCLANRFITSAPMRCQRGISLPMAP